MKNQELKVTEAQQLLQYNRKIQSSTCYEILMKKWQQLS